MNALVKVEQHEQVFEITLDRPEKRNALNWPMMMELDAAISEAQKRSGVRAVVIRGEGSGFSAGIDVTSFAESSNQFGENWRENLFPLTAAYQSVTNKIASCSVPTIALLHGYCLGLGFEIALACDFRFAAIGTKMGLPEARLGIIPDVGGTTRLTRLVGVARAKEYVMTGKNFDLTDAERWGVLNAVVAVEELQPKCEALVAELLQVAPLAVCYAKRVIDGMSDTERGLQLEDWAQSQLIRSQDFEVGVEAILTKQAPQWKGK